jgi:hypothetical protein
VPEGTSAQGRSEARIAVNAMRARLTLLGFNLAIVTFQLSGLQHRSGGAVVPGLDGTVHLAPAVVLLLGVALSFAAMVAFVASGRLDERGDCTHWSLLLGDVLMYLAMAQTVAGLFEPMLRDLKVAQVAGASLEQEFEALRIALATAGGVAWAAAAYLGPAVSFVRSPFGHRVTAALAVVYLALLLALAAVWALAQRTQLALGVMGDPPSVLKGLAVPLTW